MFSQSLSTLYLPPDALPCLRHARKSFCRILEFYFEKVWWITTEVVLPTALWRSNCTFKSICAEDCTNDGLLEVQTRLMLDRASLLFHQLSTLEQDACLRVVAALDGRMDRPR